jgi:hypothetical protein
VSNGSDSLDIPRRGSPEPPVRFDKTLIILGKRLPSATR